MYYFMLVYHKESQQKYFVTKQETFQSLCMLFLRPKLNVYPLPFSYFIFCCTILTSHGLHKKPAHWIHEKCYMYQLHWAVWLRSPPRTCLQKIGWTTTTVLHLTLNVSSGIVVRCCMSDIMLVPTHVDLQAYRKASVWEHHQWLEDIKLWNSVINDLCFSLIHCDLRALAVQIYFLEMSNVLQHEIFRVYFH